MSLFQEHQLPCPACKRMSNQKIYSSIHAADRQLVLSLLKTEINYGICPFCSNKYLIKTKLLFINHSKQYALYYTPCDGDNLETEINTFRNTLGETNYLTKAKIFHDAESFLSEIRSREVIEKKKKIVIVDDEPSFPLGFDDRFEEFWSCTICGGDSTTGCLFYDASECPNFK